MSDIDQLSGTPFQAVPDTRKLPGYINVLTILTFIGCGIGLLGSLYQTMNAKKGLDALEKMQGSDDLEKMPDFAKKFYSPEAVEMARISYQNRVPLLILGLVGIALCLYGAIQMRGLKKQGYYLYLIGEILPVIGSVVFIGAAFLTNFSGIIILIITALFVLLYTSQLKYLK